MASDSLIHAGAAVAGGVVAMSATYPLIFLSTRTAVQAGKERKSTYQAIKDIVERDGVLGLYDGLYSSLLGIAITNGIYYYFYERSKGIIVTSRKGSKGLSTIESMLAGLIAGSATTIISNPVWVVQAAQATHSMDRPANPSPSSSSQPAPSTRKPSILETVQQILSKDGVAAFWRGIGPALILVLNPIVQYTVFEQLKNLLITRRAARAKAAGVAVSTIALVSDWDYFFLGALSKLVATSSTYPCIVVKSRLQAGQAHALRYKSSLDGLLTIIREEGVDGLYKGISSKLLQSVLTAAILFAGQRRFYELTKQALGSVGAT